MRLPLVVFALLFTSCSAPEQALLQDKLPQLILQDPLPAVDSFVEKHLRIDLRLLIDKEGNVAYVEFVSPAVNAVWDSLARQTMYRWKFSPALAKGKPTRVWMRFPVLVRFTEPRIMELAEIVCESASSADSLYSLLHSGEDFSRLAKGHSRSVSASDGGRLGKVNIRRYPDDVQTTLSSLRDGSFTSPIHLGNHFIIFKRFPPVL